MKNVFLAASAAIALAMVSASPASAFEWNQSGVSSVSVAQANGGTGVVGGTIGNGLAAGEASNFQGAQSSGFAGVLANNGGTLTESGQTSIVEGGSSYIGASLGNGAQIGGAQGNGAGLGQSGGTGFSLQILP